MSSSVNVCQICLRRAGFKVGQGKKSGYVCETCLPIFQEACKGKKMVIFRFWCDVCPTKSNRKRCGRCMRVNYCSAECQKNAWPEHKKICRRVCCYMCDKECVDGVKVSPSNGYYYCSSRCQLIGDVTKSSVRRTEKMLSRGSLRC